MAEPATDDRRFDVLSGEGTDLGRLLSLSDGVFAFAMTLLVVNLVLPVVGSAGKSDSLFEYLKTLFPALGGYALSFFVVSSWWAQHHRLLSALRRYAARLTQLTNLFLLLISITPFLLALVFEYGPKSITDTGTSPRIAVGLYSAFQLGTGFVYLAMWRHATHGHRLVDADLPDEWVRYLDRHGVGRVVIMTGALAAALILPTVGEILWAGVLIDRRYVRRPVTRPRV